MIFLCTAPRWTSFSATKPTRASTTTTGSSTSTATLKSSADRTLRAAQIRRREVVMRWLRSLIIPAFMAYGLFLLRPTDGHFLRYLAERRHHEPSFNALFPPLVKSAEEKEENAMGALQQQGSSRSSSSNTLLHDEHSTAAVAPVTAKDKAWLARKLHIKTETAEDEERLARRRLLFARERALTGGDEAVVESVRVRTAEELRAEREHPPMYQLSAQLDAIAAASRAYRQRQQQVEVKPMQTRGGVVRTSNSVVDDAATVHPPPPIQIDFSDHTFFATAAVCLNSPSGTPLKTMKFVGVCGMIWKQLS